MKIICSALLKVLRLWPGILAVVLFGLQGCATYSSSFRAVDRDLAAQNYDAALSDNAKESKSPKDRVLYLLNKGMILRMKRDFKDSNLAFGAAKAEMDRLYAASVTENALSVMVNDSMVSYSGDNYERILLHLYMALNYLELGQPDSARVEAMQVDDDLREFAEKHPDSKFSEDAFTLYLTGMIYEDRGEWSDAMISYRSAYNAYMKDFAYYRVALPSTLKDDLMRMAKRVGLRNELRKYEAEFNVDPLDNKRADPDRGELVFVLNNGLAPVKHERTAAFVDPSSGIMVRISLPYYESRNDYNNNVVAARITVSDKQSTTELVENVDAIARKNLEDHMPAIIARSIARAVVKTEAVRRAQAGAMNGNNNGNNNGAMFGMLGALALQVAAVASEQADTRSWLTLPSNIQLARLSLPPGSYSVKVELLGADQMVVATQDFPNIAIRKTHKTFLTQHWIPQQITTGELK
ncbi:MAG: COG3014 family protein [Gallionella sp.]